MPTDNQTDNTPVQMPVTETPRAPKKPRGRPKKPKPVPAPANITEDTDPALIYPVELPEPPPSTEPINIVNADVDAASIEFRKQNLKWQELQDQITAAKIVPPPPPPPAVATPRQQTQIELEMAAGARRTAYFQEQDRLRTQIKPDASEGTTTPVFRDGTHVPNMDSKDPLLKTLK